MKIKLSYFLGKRGLTLQKYCERSSIKSHEELEAHLLENRIECPKPSETRVIFSALRKQKNSKNVKVTKEKRSFSPKKSTKSSKQQGKKAKNWSE